jgi:DNA-binding winged helix-turn-helix (wHTH) protein
MSHVRKALGEKANDHRFIVTIPGRGYRFGGELQSQKDSSLNSTPFRKQQLSMRKKTNVNLKPRL